MSFDFSGKKVLVTGGTRGIGRGVVEGLVKAGAAVFALGQSRPNLEALKADLPSVTIIQADVAHVQETVDALAPHQPFHGLVNNAGISIQNPFLQMPPDHFDKVLSVNLRGPTFVGQAVGRGMVEAGIKGAIVNVSSAAAQGSIQDHTAYCISKAGMDALTRMMALELGPKGIRVNSVNPTVVLTQMGREAWSDPVKSAGLLSRIPQGRFVEVEEVTAAVLWLLSDASSMTTGAAIPVEGGLWSH